MGNMKYIVYEKNSGTKLCETQTLAEAEDIIKDETIKYNEADYIAKFEIIARRY